MSKKVWESIDKKIRDMIVSAFKLADIDFEREYVREEDEGLGNSTSDSPWFTREEAATYTRCSTDTIDNWIAKGHLRHLKTDAARPGRVLIDRGSLERFLRGKLIHSRKRSHQMGAAAQGGHCVRAAE